MQENLWDKMVEELVSSSIFFIFNQITQYEINADKSD